MYKTVFIIGAVWVEPNSSAAGSRMLQLIEYFQSQGCKIVFGTTAQKNEQSLDLQILGIQEEVLKLNDASFDELLKQIDPDIVLFDRFISEEQFGWRVAELQPKALRILDTEDLHCLRKVREKQYKAGEPFQLTDLLTEEITKREVASILRSDISLMISKVEIEILTNFFKLDSTLLCYLPFLLSSVVPKTLPNFEEREHFISIGNFLHPPNLESVKTLKTKIWPQIRKQLPEAELHVYGAYPTQQAKEFSNVKEGFLVKGFVENQHEVLKKARVLLAPLSFGAGLKGKFLDGMQNGCPSVTTTIGIEGYSDEENWGGLVADDWPEFIQNSIQLYSDKSIWEASQTKGFHLLKQFDKEAYLEQFTNFLEQLSTNLDYHRNHNFMGSLLQHHTMKSSKYLSKWIEEKNKV